RNSRGQSNGRTDVDSTEDSRRQEHQLWIRLGNRGAKRKKENCARRRPARYQYRFGYVARLGCCSGSDVQFGRSSYPRSGRRNSGRNRALVLLIRRLGNWTSQDLSSHCNGGDDRCTLGDDDCYFFSLAIFLAISSISLGFKSANMLSTMLAIAESSATGSARASSANCSGAFGSLRRSLNPDGAVDSLETLAAESIVEEMGADTVWVSFVPTMVSRICFQFCHAAANSVSRWRSAW